MELTLSGAEWGPSPPRCGGWRDSYGPSPPARGLTCSRLSSGPATMPRKGTQPSTARRREEEPPQSPDGISGEAEPEPPPGTAGSLAPASAGELPAETRRKVPWETRVGTRPAQHWPVLLGADGRVCGVDV